MAKQTYRVVDFERGALEVTETKSSVVSKAQLEQNKANLEAALVQVNEMLTMFNVKGKK